jgi:stringent starvation protein B
MINAPELSSTRPYLIRDNGFTPYVAVQVDDSVQVPREYVKNGEIVLNVSFDATSSLKLGNEFIEFKARFAGTAREIIVPVGRVIAIYSRENGQGMAFPVLPPATAGEGGAAADTSSTTSAAPRMPLRDTSRGTEGDANNVVHLVGSDGSADAAETGSGGAGGGSSAPEAPEDPPRPPSTGGAKPSLKRIK